MMHRFPERSLPPVTGDNRPSPLWSRINSFQHQTTDILEQSKLIVPDENPNSSLSALRIPLNIGQLISLIPVDINGDLDETRYRNIFESLSSFYRYFLVSFRFRWLSFRVVYSLLISVTLFLYSVICAMYVAEDESDQNPTFIQSSTIAFFSSAFVISVLFFILAVRWKSFTMCFVRNEQFMHLYGYPVHLKRRINIITVVVLSLALVEHTLVQLKIFMTMDASKYDSIALLFRDYFNANYPQLFRVTSYHPAWGIFTLCLNLIATAMWTYNDLFIMIIGVTISQRFRLLNKSIEKSFNKKSDELFWRKAREAYNDLAVLTRVVDDHIGVNVLFSFLSNLYFICFQLLQTVRLCNNNIYEDIYFMFSFGFLLARTCATCLFAATIKDESKQVSSMLYSIPSTSYGKEVDRFLIQSATDDIALSGMNFFKVTRSLLLTMAGTIVTYEIVLVQLNVKGESLCSEST